MISLNEEDYIDFHTAEIETGMYLSFCLSEEERNRLKQKWNEKGGREFIPWYKYVLNNVSVKLD